MLLKRMGREKRYSTGLKALDDLLGGGLPENITVALSGPTGVGKTLFALNFAYAGAQAGEGCLFIAMEDSHKKIMRMARLFPSFDRFVETKRIVVLDYPPMEIEHLYAPTNPLRQLVEEYGVERVVLDSYYPVGISFDSPKERAQATLQMLNNMDEWGTVNLIITEDASGPTRFGLEEHTDGWIEMYKERGKRKVIVRKMRYTSFKEKAVPFTPAIGERGEE